MTTPASVTTDHLVEESERLRTWLTGMSADLMAFSDALVRNSKVLREAENDDGRTAE